MANTIQKVILLLIFLILIQTSFVTALGLSGKKLGPLIYVPGTTVTNSYHIEGTDKPVKVTIDGGGIFKHLSTTPIQDNNFELILDFPKDEKILPGEYILGLTVVEEPNLENGGGINILVAVSKNIRIEVYTYDKEIKATLDVPNVNQGSKTKVGLGAASVSYTNINKVQGEIILYDNKNHELARKTTEEKPLKSMQGIGFTETFDTEKLEPNTYFAKGIITYDGKQKELNTSFLIGNMDLVVKDYTKELPPGFSDFTIKVSNHWGNNLNNIYAKVILDNQELLQTPSINLAPWADGELKGIIKIDLEPKKYAGKLKLFYEGETKEVPIDITIKKLLEATAQEQKPQQTSEFPTVLVTVGILIMVILLLAMIFILKRKQPGEKKDEF